MKSLIEKTLDPQGRILLPKKWRVKYGKKVLMFESGDELILAPKKNKRLSDLQEIEVNIKSNLADWHAVRKELKSGL